MILKFGAFDATNFRIITLAAPKPSTLCYPLLGILTDATDDDRWVLSWRGLGIGALHLIKERTTRPYGSVRKELLATAIELFANRGYADVALRDIATKTKVHLPAIYKAFKNKRALYVECCSQVFERGTREIAAEIRPELSDEANVLAYAAQLTRVYINEPVVAKLAQRCVLDHDHELIDIIMKQAGSAYHGRIIEILERIVGARAKRCFFAISALSYGAIQLSAFRLPGESAPDPDSVEDISLFALESLLPQINWQEVKNLNDNSRARCDQTGSV